MKELVTQIRDDAVAQLRDVIRQVEVFGFHFGRLDVREHADRHRAALAEIFAKLDVNTRRAAVRRAVELGLL